MRDYINRQVEERARAWGEAKSLLDHAASEGRDLTAAEQEQYDRINADLDERTAVIERLERDLEREARAAEIRVPESPKPSTDEDMLRALVRGEIRSATFEKRQMTTSGNAGLVPEGFYSVMQEQMRFTGPWSNEEVGYTILNTASGEDIKVPTQSGFSSATATAEAAAFAVSNPTTSSLTLRSHKFGTLLTVSRELLEDSGIDIVSFLGRQAGNAIGQIVNEKLAVGTGTVEPNGIVNASTLGKTGGTAVGGAFTADDLIDLVHSVDSAYASNRAGFQMRRSTLAALRSLKDGEGRFIYDPTQGTQALVLGYPVFENPHVAAIGTGAKSVIFGSMPYYHVRQVGGVEIARSDDAYFVNDLVAFRVSIRLDGNLSQTAAVKHFIGNAA
ncbi:MAG TPA: phage major capsid protein [Acidimicrobiia bacterium]